MIGGRRKEKDCHMGLFSVNIRGLCLWPLTRCYELGRALVSCDLVYAPVTVLLDNEK